jgi:hypothetical protein
MRLGTAGRRDNALLLSSAPVEYSVPVDCAGWRRVVRSAAGYDHAFAEATERGQPVGAALDDLDLVDDAFGVPVGGRLLEICEELLVPAAHASGERVEGGQGGAVDGGQERVQALLGVVAAAGAVDVSERFLQPPRLGEDRVACEQVAEAVALAGVQALGRFEQPVSRVVELGAPAPVLAAASGSLGALGAPASRCRSRRTASSAVLAPRTRWKRSHTIRASGSAVRIAWR